MASTKPSLSRKKRATNNSTGNSTGSPSADSGTSQAQSSSSSSFASSNTNAPPPPLPPPSSSSATTSSSAPPPRLTAQRSVPAFLNKLYNMVEDSTTNDLIRWSKDGTSFIVERHEEFAKTVLPRFYKHNTFASFVRQLNMYDFHKVPHLQQGVMIAENEYEIWEFSNPHFQQGRPDLLVLVTRKRNRDKDIVDTENVTLSTLVQDLSAIKKQQSSIGIDLRDLHRDNEILWQETLNAREKYQSHQEAIEKILQFLTAIFVNDHLAISMNNGDSLPRGLIEEAASLAGMSTKLDDMSKINSSTPMSSSVASSALSNIFSSAIRLYSASNSPDQRNINQANKTEDGKPMPNSFESVIQYPQSPQEMTSDQDKAPSIVDFSRTLNIATRSAQSITQDIDMLQASIESLANNLGVDPSQFDDDMEADIGLHDNYSHMLSTVNQPNDPKLYAIADTNPEFYDSYRRKPENMTNVVPNQFSFNLQNPPPSSRQYQQQQQQQKL
ncbi:uncharacterized protein B0P05DRAFT_467684, partial [Gilbertella persicaria]|uniref:uncharacterized protein n=1 Tax=Gilbertella persicaria TaxID=101096 RepID=UPI002220542A